MQQEDQIVEQTQNLLSIEEKPSQGKKQIVISLSILLFLVLVTTGFILYGSGYQLVFEKGKPQIGKTGILNASSTPKGADVYVNDHHTAVTTQDINLSPGQYTIRIEREGYNPWRKNIQIKEQEVANTDAVLWPIAPALQPISTFNIENPVVDPTGKKIAFRISTQSLRKNGIYVLDMTAGTFPVLVGQSTSNQIVNDTTDVFSKSYISWSPDGQEILARIEADTPENKTYYLLKANTFNEIPQDVTATIVSLEDEWSTQRTTKEQAQLTALKPRAREIVKKYFRIISRSPDETKILYQATASANIPIIINPRRIGNNLLYERRDLQKSGIYVYNIIEDINTRIIEHSPEQCNSLDPSCTQQLFRWMPDSKHLTYVHDKKIDIVEEDGANMTTIYAGPFVDHYVFPWPDGSKIVILTNLNNTNIPPTLYTISLK